MSELFSGHSHGFTCDGVYCYARGNRIPQADAATFKIVENSYMAR